MSQCARVRRGPDRRQQTRLGEHPSQSSNERAMIGGIDEESMLLVLYKLWSGAVGGGDHGKAAPHRLETDNAEPLSW